MWTENGEVFESKEESAIVSQGEDGELMLHIIQLLMAY